jgi:peptide deformylase
MAIRNIRKEEDPILKKMSKEVLEIDDKVIELLDDMAETMYDANGIGLAAVQVGVLKRVMIIDIGEELIEMINPVLVRSSGEQLEMEGCLSLPGLYGEVKRPKEVLMEGLNRKGEKIVIEGHGLLTRALCHELDHLNGILFKDKVVRFVNSEEEED